MEKAKFRFPIRRMMIAVVLLTPLLMLVRGVLRAKEAARRAVCTSNAKGITVLLHYYHEANGTFPPGTVRHPTLPPERRLNWITDPSSRMSGTRPTPDRTKAWDVPPNWPAISDARFTTCPDHPSYEDSTRPRPLTYIGIAGLGADAPTLPSGHPRAGVFGYDRTTRIFDIKDGLAQTMIIAESAQDLAPWSAGGPSSVRGVDPATRPYIGPSRPFGGYHPGGATVAMADGSIRHIRASIDPNVFEAMSTIAGGEPVP